jgi:hypothetical protein
MKTEYPPHVLAAVERGEALSRKCDVMIEAGKLSINEKFAATIAPLPIAKGRIAKPRGMNKLEAAYGEHLLARQAAGEVAWSQYEGLTFKLGDDCRFTPDWGVMLSNGEFELHETKGPHRREDSIVKLRIAARIYPFRFYLITRDADGKWEQKEVTP